jgi:CheY-like chemotaxis protein
VHACTHAQAALDALAGGEPFDLLLSDVALGPGLRGTELAQRAREHRPTLPVLLMSGYAAEADAPADVPLLRKPFTREALADAVVRATRTA